jgi:hypothetical protein
MPQYTPSQHNNKGKKQRGKTSTQKRKAAFGISKSKKAKYELIRLLKRVE